MSHIAGKIDVDGWLLILRGGELREQLCPFTPNSTDENPARCGDHCPLFSEPVTGGEGAARTTFLRICHDKTWVFDKFDDCRPQAGPEQTQETKS